MQVKADINVTPLVDVVLVLLIIFMLVTPLIHDQVRLPATAHAIAREAPKQKVLITLDGDRTVRIDGMIVAPSEIRTRLLEAHARTPSAVVAVKADARLPYGDVKSALVSVHDAGFDRVGLITQPPNVAAGSQALEYSHRMLD